MALVGAALVVLSILSFAIPVRSSRCHSNNEGFLFGSITGVLIAFYTVWDKHAVASRAIPPFLMEWITSLTRVVCLLPFALKNWESVREDWRIRRGYAVLMGALNPRAYLLVLMAMTFTPISSFAPTREVSILAGARSEHTC